MRGVAEDIEVISAYRGWFDWRLRELWRYRDLLALLVWRDFVSVYKQTILGPAWHIIRPLMTTFVFTIIFGRVAGLSTDGTPPFLFYLAGTIAWMYFATCLDQVAKTFVGHGYLLGKVYFHRLVVPLSLIVSNVVSFGIQVGIFVAVLGGYVLFAGMRLHPSAWLLLLPLLIAMLAGYALGAGAIVCATTARYRDVAYLVSFGLQLAMYVTPVIYPVSAIPVSYRWMAMLNPLSPVFEGIRKGIFGVGTVTPGQIGASALVMMGVLTVGIALFTRVERTFLDTV